MTAQETTTVLPQFTDFNLKSDLLRGITAAGFTQPSPVQAEAIPAVQAGQDLIGQARTGSGKTAAFVIPALNALTNGKNVEVVVLVPTRELATQVLQEFEKIGQFLRIHAVKVVGGESIFRQIELINRGAQIVVATPGRLLDLLKSGKVAKRLVPELIVLDEADEMLDMGFIDDVKEILSHLSDTCKQKLLFSATMPPAIHKLARDYLTDPAHIRLNTQRNVEHEDIEQRFYFIRNDERDLSVFRLLVHDNATKTVIFCRTRGDANDLTRKITTWGLKAIALHGELSQNERTRAMQDFKDGLVNILVATDVASRGLDVPELSHVVNYHIPESKERFTHRMGRTGRAGNKGVAITLLTREDFSKRYYLRDMKAQIMANAHSIPTKSDVQQRIDTTLINKIFATPILDDAYKACDDLFAQDLGREFALKLFSYLKKDFQVFGPEKVGAMPQELFDRGGDRRRGNDRFSSRRGGDRFPRRGGDNDRFSGRRGGSDRFPRHEDGERSSSRRDGGERFPRRDDGDRFSPRRDDSGRRPHTARGGYPKPRQQESRSRYPKHV